jgi:hypothetical protein
MTEKYIPLEAGLRNQIAQTIAKWCIANGEEFFPNPLADKIIETLEAVSRAQPKLFDVNQNYEQPELGGANEMSLLR